jgi:two-component system CheB/CheR fusion protein
MGLKYIKEASGTTIAQTEESSIFKEMPQNAIETGVVDYRLLPEEMPDKIFKFSTHQIQSPELPFLDQWDHDSTTAHDIYDILREHTGHDFSLYKKSTIYRRIVRRMNIRQIESLKNYANFLLDNNEEIEMLFQDLLIGVTYFFRNSESFEALKSAIYNSLLTRSPDKSVFRVWVPGCSTGEEAYSIAIVIDECLKAIDTPIKIQIFSTDVDENAIAIARTGSYPSTISDHISSARLEAYFIKDSRDTFHIKKTIREMVIFASQNSIKDPPFRNLDLISCRNLLIYLGQTLQQKLISSFHYSLNPGGILFLGSSESTGRCHNLFDAIDEKHKIFKRNKDKSTITRALFPVFNDNYAPPKSTNDNRQDLMRPEKCDTASIVQAILDESEHPPCVVIDREDNVTYIHGKTGAYLEPAQGRLNLNIFHMAQGDLQKVLSSGIRQVRETRLPLRIDNLTITEGNANLQFDLSIKPLRQHRSCADLVMILFQRSIESSPPMKSKKTSRRHKNKNYKSLEHELTCTKNDLQAKIRELEASNEQLKFTNEELQTINEELQSSNEELETSKEELQSLNEEASTTNAQLQNRMNEISNINDDMKNLLDSTEIATLFLDNDICVRRFTPRTQDIIPLIETDCGRALDNFSTNLIEVDLPKLCRSVLKECSTQEYQVQNTIGRFYTMRLRPYRTQNNAIDGVVITFENNTEKFNTKEALKKQQDLLDAIIKNSSDLILIINSQQRIAIVNEPLCDFLGHTEAELIGRYFSDIFPSSDVPCSENPDSTKVTLGGAHGQFQDAVTRVSHIHYSGDHDSMLYIGKPPCRRSN